MLRRRSHPHHVVARSGGVIDLCAQDPARLRQWRNHHRCKLLARRRGRALSVHPRAEHDGWRSRAAPHQKSVRRLAELSRHLSSARRRDRRPRHPPFRPWISPAAGLGPDPDARNLPQVSGQQIAGPAHIEGRWNMPLTFDRIRNSAVINRGNLADLVAAIGAGQTFTVTAAAPTGYTRKFQHQDWIDFVDPVQAGGNNGFNQRFHALESEFELISAAISSADSAISGLQTTSPAI